MWAWCSKGSPRCSKVLEGGRAKDILASAVSVNLSTSPPGPLKPAREVQHFHQKVFGKQLRQLGDEAKRGKYSRLLRASP